MTNHSDTLDAATLLRTFIDHYYDTSDEDLYRDHSKEQLQAFATNHAKLLFASAAESVHIEVFPVNQEGQDAAITLVQIVHPDMPFLVDSVTMAVNTTGRTAQWVVHPIYRVFRNQEGEVVQIESASGAPLPNGAKQEQGLRAETVSCIMVQCESLPSDAGGEALKHVLRQALDEVRASVQDWRSMLSRLQSLAASLTRLESPQAQESKAFLGWLENNHFTFLGAKDYDWDGHGGLRTIPESGLGILRSHLDTEAEEPPLLAKAFYSEDQYVMASKAMRRSRVHRPAWLDAISVKRLNEQGQVIGETRFFGLYTSKAYAEATDSIPLLRTRVAFVRGQAKLVQGSHADKALQAIFETYPRDELFQIDQDTLAKHALGILRLQERQRVRVFVRMGAFSRLASVLVFVPREVYNTELRIKLSQIILDVFDGAYIEFTPMLTDSPLARIHYVVRAKTTLPERVDVAQLEARVSEACKRWEDGVHQALIQQGLVGAAWVHGFPSAYREVYSAQDAAFDAQMLDGLEKTIQAHAAPALTVHLYQNHAQQLRFKVYAKNKMALSDALPVLEAMGVRVIDEHPYEVKIGQSRQGGASALWIHDFGLECADAVQEALQTEALKTLRPRFEALFLEAWQGRVESDSLNKLVLATTSLGAREIALLRAFTRYFKQLGLPYAQSYIEESLNKHPDIAQNLWNLFDTRFNPEAYPADGMDQREQQTQQITHMIQGQLEQVSSLDEDRILRQFLSTILATLRTNFYQYKEFEGWPYFSFKLSPREIPNMPEPKPLFEIWVYSPRMEGVHLRGGKVARGGLRWSDRSEDFRTEILGLVKAQQVKNTVIVPVGSKGGFVLKKAPPPSDREAYLNEGKACYKTFLSGLLDITDNLVKGSVLPPSQCVRYDGDDPYLVVAADKGTATFSDIANGMSAQYGFWLGDAFASGGSVGYDHKKMGITARGAWESVKRHFRGLGVDTQSQPFTVAGIGDMSGDVFGNGMLLSEHIKLVFAFDHRHIFIDPAPDCAVSYKERARLFALPRSSWEDYDKALISSGGGVYARTAKSISLSPQALALLAHEDSSKTEFTPNELIHAILKSPVDLIYNGGIGTYVKAQFESHAQVGDKAGDAIRVDGRQLRCKVFVEGGNLGCTQNGRIEFSQNGGLIYTDAIDNSAGVDCSDHEVNIKILLGSVQEEGLLDQESRNDLLASMTEEVAHLVLQDNYYQTQQIELAVMRPLYWLEGQARLMRWLEEIKLLNRKLEFLPSEQEIERRKAQGQGLTRPENAVLMSYAKMNIYEELLLSDVPDDAFFAGILSRYFPKVLGERYGQQIAQHRLRREIIATYLTNTVVNRMGATFVNFLASQAACTAADVVRAYTLAREVFDLEPLWDKIDALDGTVTAQRQLELLTRLSTIAQKASRWMLRHRGRGDLNSMLARYKPAAKSLRSQLTDCIPTEMQAQLQAQEQAIREMGVEQALAQDLVALDYLFPVLDLVDIAEQTQRTVEETARTYFALDGVLSLATWREQIGRLPSQTLWQAQARASARDDLYSIAGSITADCMRRQEAISAWQKQHLSTINQLQHLRDVVVASAPDLAPISVALKEMRNLIAA